MPRRTIEIASTGIDEFFQVIAGDPFGGTTSMGLRVPTKPTSDPRARYLFNGASFSVADGEKARIIGMRQFVSIGVGDAGIVGEGAGPRLMELEVSSPNWRFADGNVWMGIHRTGAPNSNSLSPSTPTPVQLRSTAFRNSIAPALLYEELVVPAGDPYYVHLTDYAPPYGGRPPGTLIEAGTTFLDLRTQWRTFGTWGSIGFPISGPDTVSLFVSVKQTDPATRQSITVPDPLYEGGMPPEELFLLNYPTAVYWRVGVSLVVEFE